jgi:hypothetical protein
MPIKPTRLTLLIRRLEGDDIQEFGPYKALRSGPGRIKFRCDEYLAPGPKVRFQMRHQTKDWRELDGLRTREIIAPYTYVAHFVDRYFED